MSLYNDFSLVSSISNEISLFCRPVQKIRGFFMYLAQTTKNRIKSVCKTKNISMETLLSECELGINAIRQINDTKGMASFSLAKIADYLDCSVDYLLGRTDNPESHKS